MPRGIPRHRRQIPLTASPAEVADLRGDGKSQAEIATELFLSRSRVANLYRVADRAKPQWMRWVIEGRLTIKHIEAVLSLPPDAAENLLRSAFNGQKSASALREAVAGTKARGKATPESIAAAASNAKLERDLSYKLGTDVRLRPRGTGQGGELVLTYTNLDTLDGLLQRLGYSER